MNLRPAHFVDLLLQLFELVIGIVVDALDCILTQVPQLGQGDHVLLHFLFVLLLSRLLPELECEVEIVEREPFRMLRHGGKWTFVTIPLLSRFRNLVRTHDFLNESIILRDI